MLSALRPAAALTMIALGALIGHRLGERVRLRRDTLMMLTEDMDLLRVSMLEKRLPLQDALASCRSPVLAGDLSSWRQRAALLPLTAPDTQCLEALFARLGCGTPAEQALLLPQIQARLAALQQEAAQKYQTLGRLYTSLGALGALALALLFV